MRCFDTLRYFHKFWYIIRKYIGTRDLTEEIMKKITTILLTLLLGFAMAGCTTQDDAGTPEDVVNPTNLTFS